VVKVTTQAAQKPENRLVRYFKETRAELRKVTWPTRTQAINLTLIVLAVTVVMALFLGAFDLLFATLIRELLS
jgi:preprotein translocase subunit SecE